MAAATSVAGSHVSPQVRSNPRTTVECPLSLQHAVGLRPNPKGGRTRVTRIVSRGLAPLAGKGRASARAVTGDGCSTSVERPEPLGSGLRGWLAISEGRERKLAAIPRFRHILARGANGRSSG